MMNQDQQKVREDLYLNCFTGPDNRTVPLASSSLPSSAICSENSTSREWLVLVRGRDGIPRTLELDKKIYQVLRLFFFPLLNKLGQM